MSKRNKINLKRKGWYKAGILGKEVNESGKFNKGENEGENGPQ